MKHRGFVAGLLFLLLMGFLFQSEIDGFLAEVRASVYDTVDADMLAMENLPKLDESDQKNVPLVPELKDGNTGETQVLDGEKPVSSDSYKEVSLYFIDNNDEKLAMEKRSIKSSSGVAKATLDELIMGPIDKKLTNLIPTGTKVLGVNIKSDGTAVVDLSKEIMSAKLDSTEERLLLYSIVETMCQFPTVKQVQIKVDGKEVKTICGHWDISKPLVKGSNA